jgi:hypothetical protein
MISSKNDATTSFALDTQGLGDLKRSAKAGAPTPPAVRPSSSRPCSSTR